MDWCWERQYGPCFVDQSRFVPFGPAHVTWTNECSCGLVRTVFLNTGTLVPVAFRTDGVKSPSKPVEFASLPNLLQNV